MDKEVQKKKTQQREKTKRPKTVPLSRPDDKLVELLAKAKQWKVNLERAEEFACMEFVLEGSVKNITPLSIQKALDLRDRSRANGIIERLNNQLLSLRVDQGRTILQVLSVEKLDSDYFMSLSTSEIEYLHYFSKLYSNYTYCKITYTNDMRKRIADILEGTKDEKKLKALFKSANAIDQTDPPSDQQADLMAEIPSMSDDQIKLMSLLAEHFRFANWQPSEQYGSFEKSGDPLKFVQKAYAERLITGNFCLSDIKPYDEALYNSLKFKKTEVLTSINLPKMKKLYDKLMDEGWISEATTICKMLETIRKSSRNKPSLKE